MSCSFNFSNCLLLSTQKKTTTMSFFFSMDFTFFWVMTFTLVFPSCFSISAYFWCDALTSSGSTWLATITKENRRIKIIAFSCVVAMLFGRYSYYLQFVYSLSILLLNVYRIKLKEFKIRYIFYVSFRVVFMETPGGSVINQNNVIIIHDM